MVPMEGVEPTHPYGYQILSLARLPIPPHRLPGEGEDTEGERGLQGATATKEDDDEQET